MHQSSILFIHWRNVFSNLPGTKLTFLSVFWLAIAASASGFIFTNHCLDSIGSTTQLFLSECPTEWMIFSCLMKLPSLLIFSNNFSRQTKRSRPTNSPHFSFIVASLLKMIGISKPYFLPMIKSFGSWAGVHFIAPVPNSTST